MGRHVHGVGEEAALRQSDLVADDRPRADGADAERDEAPQCVRRRQRPHAGRVAEGRPGSTHPIRSLSTSSRSTVRSIEVRTALTTGGYRALGEVAIQYQGAEPGDPRFEPLPGARRTAGRSGVHSRRHRSSRCTPTWEFPDYRARLHSPLLIEEALLRHPKLRVSLMHAGWPMLDDLLATMWTHPQVYVDVGADRLRAPAGRIPLLPAADRGGRVRQAGDVRIGSDGLAGNDRGRHRPYREGGISDRRPEARHSLQQRRAVPQVESAGDRPASRAMTSNSPAVRRSDVRAFVALRRTSTVSEAVRTTNGEIVD